MTLIVVTSWDDGRQSDARLAALLDKYGLKGTFYVTTCKTAKLHSLTGGRKSEYSISDRGEMLSDAEIAEIARRHEIGCHTDTHPPLKEIDRKTAEKEITTSKTKLEKIIGRKVVSFSYPYGIFSDDIIDILKESGITNARATGRFNTYLPTDPLRITPTFDVFPRKSMPGPKYIRDMRNNAHASLGDIMAAMMRGADWLKQAKLLLDISARKGSCFHLWGHSWMIQKFGMWDDLEAFFEYIRKHEITPMTVTEIAKSEGLKP